MTQRKDGCKQSALAVLTAGPEVEVNHLGACMFFFLFFFFLFSLTSFHL